MVGFTWGDLVRIKCNAPPEYRPGDLGDIVGITEISTQEQVKAYKSLIGARFYLIEFSDGTAIEVEERWLEKAKQCPPS